jgi:transcriptional regulator with XRE-family HTH domain
MQHSTLPGQTGCVTLVDMDFAAKLNAYLTRTRASNTLAADKLGVSRETVRRWRFGDGGPRLEELANLARWTKIPLDYWVLNEIDALPEAETAASKQTLLFILEKLGVEEATRRLLITEPQTGVSGAGTWKPGSVAELGPVPDEMLNPPRAKASRSGLVSKRDDERAQAEKGPVSRRGK